MSVSNKFPTLDSVNEDFRTLVEVSSVAMASRNLLLLLFVFLNCALLLLALRFSLYGHEAYDYIDSHYPLEAPIRNLGLVAMTQFETTHFQLNVSNPISDKEWRSIYSGPYTMHLGAEQKIFLIALYHQTHCLRGLEYAFLHPNSTAYTPQHIQHCLNYLRQHFLCQADDELETSNFLEWDHRPGSVSHKGRVCRDWYMVHDAASNNLRDFRTHVQHPRDS